MTTVGNPDCHVILRGGAQGPNADAASVSAAAAIMRKAGLRANLMVDCSHGNSRKDFRAQPGVAHALVAQVSAGNREMMGVMIESHLVEGRQDLLTERSLVYGQSITDACLGWQETVPLLDELATAVRERRGRPPDSAR